MPDSTSFSRFSAKNVLPLLVGPTENDSKREQLNTLAESTLNGKHRNWMGNQTLRTMNDDLARNAARQREPDVIQTRDEPIQTSMTQQHKTVQKVGMNASTLQCAKARTQTHHAASQTPGQFTCAAHHSCGRLRLASRSSSGAFSIGPSTRFRRRARRDDASVAAASAGDRRSLPSIAAGTPVWPRATSEIRGENRAKVSTR